MLLAASEITRQVDRVFIMMGGVCLVLLVGITVTMVLFVIKYRRSRTTTTTQIEGHKLLEIVWIVIPTLIVTWMFYIGYQGFELMRQVPQDAMVVEVTGRQWAWSFNYPAEGIDTPEMVVPVNNPIKCEIFSPPDDVIHSFFIPEFRIKEDAVPGRRSYLWFHPQRKGVFNIFCAEFCGKDHAKMISMLRVVSEDEFEQWLANEKSKRYLPLTFGGITNPQHQTFGPEGLNIDARAIYQTFCVSCHGAGGDGSGLPGEARNFATLEGWKQGAKVTDIYRTLMTGIEGTRMRSYPNLMPWQRVALAHYVRSFIKDPAPADMQEDFAALVKQYQLDKIQKPKETIPIQRAMEILVSEANKSGS
ncbi:MAG: cytochrome c oxidase subunit II [Planctomycetota bacterium]|jgi:cytochrome c oxidase subunit II